MSPIALLVRPRAFIVAVLLLSLLSLANAAYVLVGPQGFRDGGGSMTGATAGAFCNASAAPFGSGTTGTALNVREHGSGQMITDCNYTGGPFGSGTHFVDSAGFGYCPSGGGVFAGGGGNCWNTAASCPEGSELGSGGFCEPLAGCAGDAGQTREVNATVGWTRTNNDDDYGFVGGLTPIPASMCSGGCTVTKTGSPRCWVSKTPSAEGLYRNSCDIEVTVTASSCTATSDLLDPMTPDKSCDGTVGYVNGKRTCVKGSPSADPVAPALAPERYGNPTAGSTPNPTDANNPAGREPTGGNGGNAGGPPTGDSAGSPRGTGTGPGTGGAGGGQTIKVEIPDLKDPCGIPGSPPCKIDETGTPDGEGAFGAAGDGLDDAKDQIIDLINGIKDDPGPPPWTWTFALPTGCSPIPVGGFAPFLEPIDICEFQPMFHDLMSVVWLMGTVIGCVALLYRTLLGGN